MKIPYMIIVGEKEQENNEVAIRRHGMGDVGTMPIEDFVELFNNEIKSSLPEL